MLPVILSAIGATLTPEELTAAARVISTRENQGRGVYRVLDELTGVLVEYHPYKNLVLTTPGGLAAGWSNAGVPNRYTATLVSQSKGLTNLGFLPGGDNSNALGISSQGKTIVGAAEIGFNIYAFARTAAEGMVNLDVDPSFAIATAVSDDGRTVVGFGITDGSFVCHRTDPAPPATTPLINNVSFLPFLLDSTFSIATDVTRDGLIVVGCAYMTSPLPRSIFNATYHAYRWSQADGSEDLGLPVGATLAAATGVSDDGNTITGYFGHDDPINMPVLPSLMAWTNLQVTVESEFVPFDTEPDIGAFIWKRIEGFPDTLTSIGLLPGGNSIYAAGISGDGKTIVGYGNTPVATHAFRWTEAEGVVDIGIPAGASESAALAVSKNGDTIVGVCMTPSGRRPFIWRKAGGFVWPDLSAVPDISVLPGGAHSLATCFSD